MKTKLISLTAACAAALLVAPTFAEEPKTEAPAASPAAGQPNEQEMMAKMMEMAQPGANHKILADMVGTWKYKVKFWMAPGAPPSESTGTTVYKSIMGGRYVIGDVMGQMEMPGADGKMKKTEFKGMSIDAYDNVKQKFVSTWLDNMGTGVMMMEGTYDPATQSLTYTGTAEMMPGMTSKVRQVVKVGDKNQHSMEYYEDRGQGEMKTMEINYTRKK
jgi:hypothetical protein